MKLSFSLITICLAFFTLTSVQAQDYTPVSLEEINQLNTAVGRPWVSVHDPSVVQTAKNTFYIIGSHRAFARSTDNMISWQGLNGDAIWGTVNSEGKVVSSSFYEAFTTNQTKKVKVLVNGVVTEVDFGNYDASAWAKADDAEWNLGGNMWAPDIIYNTTMKKWCMYMSVNGTAHHSVIVLLTADNIMGPYVYQGPVTFSGFLSGNNASINWKKTDLELVIGTQSTLPDRYNKGNSWDWGQYWPNDIDPCVFYDDDKQLWMSYGSWSGGIFMLKLDAETGLRDYTVTYPYTTENGGRPVTDPYFGKRIAGGYYSSGEASYIQKIGKYYYLFMSYGGLESTGGYQMAIFRSEKPDGPYLDAQNLDAFYNGRGWSNYGPNQQTIAGIRPLGSYEDWAFMSVGELAQGHNSAIVDTEGRAFLVYHTRFNDGGEGHQVRVHQLFSNEDGWPCTAPFQFDGETDTDETLAAGCRYTDEEIAGEYEVLIHRYYLDHANRECVTPINLTLDADGSISGDGSGKWEMKEGTAYIKVVVDNKAYKGVVVQQQIDGTAYKAICFTATAIDGVTIWGWKMEPASAIAYTYKNFQSPIPSNKVISKNIDLSSEGFYGAHVEWVSSEPDVVSNKGQYSPRETATPLELTCNIACGNYAYTQVYSVRAAKAATVTGDPLSDIIAYYDFEAKPTYNLYDKESRSVIYGRLGTTNIAATIEEVSARYGNAAHVYEGDKAKNSFMRIPNPLYELTGITGFTISAWILRSDNDDLLNPIWCFSDRAGNATKQNLFLTGNGYLGFTNETDKFDINQPDDEGSNPTNYIPGGSWNFVTVSVSATDGVMLVVNGANKYHKTFTSTAGTATTPSAAAKLFDYQKVIDAVVAMPYVQFGVGISQGSPEIYVDDVLIHGHPFVLADARGLNTLANRKTDFSPEGTSIDAIVASNKAQSNGIFDLSGRRIESTQGANLRPGLYIINGRKVLIK